MAIRHDGQHHLGLPDEVIQNDGQNLVTARGDVEVRYQGRTLRAQEVTYDRSSGVVTARGQTAIINPDGSAQFAESITLDEQMRAGIATGFSTVSAAFMIIVAKTLGLMGTWNFYFWSIREMGGSQAVMA